MDTNSFLKIISDKYYINLIKNISPKYDMPEHRLFIIDLNCKNAWSVLQNAEKNHLFRSPYKWLLIGKTENLQAFYFGTDSQIFVLDPEGVSTIYKYSRNLPNLVKHVYNNSYTSTRRRNLMGTTIKVSYVITNLDSLNHLWDYRLNIFFS